MAALALATSACNEPTFVSPTTPSITVALAASTTAEPVPAAPTSSRLYEGTLVPGTSQYYSFSFTTYGGVLVTLEGLSDESGPISVPVEVALGTPRGTECSALTIVAAIPFDQPHISDTLQGGTYCVRIADPGQLPRQLDFSIRIDTP